MSLLPQSENRQSGIRLLVCLMPSQCGAPERPGPRHVRVLALFLRGCKQPNLSSVAFSAAKLRIKASSIRKDMGKMLLLHANYIFLNILFSNSRSYVR